MSVGSSFRICNLLIFFWTFKISAKLGYKPKAAEFDAVVAKHATVGAAPEHSSPEPEVRIELQIEIETRVIKFAILDFANVKRIL